MGRPSRPRRPIEENRSPPDGAACCPRSGTVFTEKILQFDGVANLAIQAIPNHFPVIAATVLVAAMFIVIANLVVDVVYSALDPRVRLR